MNKREFEQKIRSIRQTERGLKPDAEWVARTRETLLMQVGNSMPASSLSWGRAAKEWMRHVLRMPKTWLVMIRRPVLATLSIFGVVAGGSIASVSAAEKSVPGDLLFGVKLVTEQARLALTSDKTDKLKLKTEFVSRRTKEINSIASSGVSGKSQRLNEAAEIVKRDLDTVKTQLTEVSTQASPKQAAEAAKLIDQKSSELVTALKNVKADVPDAVRSNVVAAEVAAVNTGVQAVQVLIDSQGNPDVKGIVSRDDLVNSIHQKVQGLEENVVDAAHKLGVTVTSTAVTTTGDGTSTMLTVVASASTSTPVTMAQIANAQEALAQTKQLLQEDKLGQVSNKLIETTKAIVTVEQAVDSFNASSTAASQNTTTTLIITTTSSTLPSGGTAAGVGSSTNSNSLSAPSSTTSTPK